MNEDAIETNKKDLLACYLVIINCVFCRIMVFLCNSDLAIVFREFRSKAWKYSTTSIK
jgi:hypothetical protein